MRERAFFPLGGLVAAAAMATAAELSTPLRKLPASSSYPREPQGHNRRLGRMHNLGGKPFSSRGRPPTDLSPAASSSFKKLKRFYRAHPDQIVMPDEKAKLRHAWYRKEKDFARLRVFLGQELPGDRAFLASAP